MNSDLRTLRNPLLKKKFLARMFRINGDDFDVDCIDYGMEYHEALREMPKKGYKTGFPEYDLPEHEPTEIELLEAEYQEILDAATVATAPERELIRVTAKEYVPKLWNKLVEIAKAEARLKHVEFEYYFDRKAIRRRLDKDCEPFRWAESTITDALPVEAKDASKRIGGIKSGIVRKKRASEKEAIAQQEVEEGTFTLAIRPADGAKIVAGYSSDQTTLLTVDKGTLEIMDIAFKPAHRPSREWDE